MLLELHKYPGLRGTLEDLVCRIVWIVFAAAFRPNYPKVFIKPQEQNVVIQINAVVQLWPESLNM